MKAQQLVDAMASTIDATAAIAHSLGDEEWQRETGCPGWTVQDTVAHLAGLEHAIMTGVEPDHALPVDLAHVSGPFAEYMEVHVDARRGRTPADVLAEFDDVFAQRLAQLRAMPDAGFDEPSRGPMGTMNPLNRTMLTRVFDLWAHEQDIRRAVGRPGGMDSLAAQVSLTTCTRAAGGVAASAMPDGSTLVWRLDGPFGGDFAWSYAEGVATRLDEAPPAPTLVLQTDTETFAVLCCGRADAQPERVTVEGDAAVGAAVIGTLGFTP